MKSYPKINIFLKITGKSGNYHQILSRFIIFKGIYDEIEIVAKSTDELILNDNIKDNIIKKAYKNLCDFGFKNELNEFFKTKQIKLTKQIPQGGGLGGGSSNAASFLLLVNNELNLKISNQKLLEIARNLGSDVSFFITKFPSANVSGTGDIVCQFDDDIPNLELVLSDIFCSTPDVFKNYRENFYNPDIKFAKTLLKKTSKEILTEFKNYELNDLLRPCMALYPGLNLKNNEFLSGSGSTKFRKIIVN